MFHGILKHMRVTSKNKNKAKNSLVQFPVF